MFSLTFLVLPICPTPLLGRDNEKLGSQFTLTREEDGLFVALSPSSVVSQIPSNIPPHKWEAIDPQVWDYSLPGRALTAQPISVAP